jgi:putative membrane-bound dehydrogenase-like protein
VNALALPALLLIQAPKDQTVPPEQAARRMIVPDGFVVTLFAGEPDIRQPNAMCLDDRGRVWVAENYSYTGPQGPWEPTGRDRILIFEDRDGDGRFDERKVFIDTLSFVSGLEIGYGGVWVGSPPNLLFIPDRDGDDRPDGPPRVVLDGWGHQDQHETLNSFIWGPDGWLYGCQGVFTHSRVGKPGTPDDRRVPLNAAWWRYHPTKDRFEVFAEGTSNSWGIDFDDLGQAFGTACVIPHLYHVIQGARYQRQSGKHFNPYTYDDIKHIGDHTHVGIEGRKGGHAHGGARIYQADAFPAEWRGKLIMGTIHHHGMYADTLERRGSGFVGRHVGDFLMANDPYYLGFNFDVGPDGAITVIDWYDPRECHGQTPEHQQTGRIYKIAYGNKRAPPTPDLRRLPSADLVALQLHSNEWYVRHARRILAERGPDPATHRALATQLAERPEVSRRLRALWALHATGGLSEETLLTQLAAPNEYQRAWAVQLLAEDGNASDAVLARWAQMAREDESPVVRLYLACAMQRTAPERRWSILEALAAHGEDADDHNLPLMLWYALEPLVPLDAKRALALASGGKIPLLRKHVARRVAEGGVARPEAAVPISGDGLVLRIGVEIERMQSEASQRPQIEDVAGRRALRFDGKDDHLVVGHGPNLAFTKADSYTLAAWVHCDGEPRARWQGIVVKSRDASPWYGLWINPDRRWTFGGRGNVVGSEVKPGWHHLCGVQEGGGERKLYVDGVQVGSGPAIDADGPGDLWVGGCKSVDEFFAGAIADVRLYRRALSAAEAAALAR